MTKPLLVVNVVGLTRAHLGEHTPCITALANDGFARSMHEVFPAVTCSAQASLLTGLAPAEHGIVANGWYHRDLSEVMFWKQSNRLVSGETVYAAAKKRDPRYTTAKMFWWFNMYADVEWSMTPRPCYPADGRKLFDSYSQPAEWKDELQAALGVFPLPRFWGPMADIESSRWIASASLSVLERPAPPSLTLVYLPHLDYNLQRLGPNDPRISADLRAVDAEAGRLIAAARRRGMDVVVLSEYGITQVSQPVHINRVLRDAGFLTVRNEITGWETLDCGASRAFAVADHQVAMVYVKRSDDVAAVAERLRRTPGIERVLDRDEQIAAGIAHSRSGEIVAVAAPGAWFTYYYWLDDRVAPDYARCIDIHRKPGYDPVELFINPKIWFPKLHVASRLLKKILGFRYYMDVIGLDASLVKGSHGRIASPAAEATEAPVFICGSRAIERDTVSMIDVKSMLLELQFGG